MAYVEWLPQADVLAQLGVDQANADEVARVERARAAVVAFVERQRADLWAYVDNDGDGVAETRDTFDATDDVKAGALLVVSRLHARRQSPAGIASYGEFGPAHVLRFDPDAAQLLSLGRYAPPKVG